MHASCAEQYSLIAELVDKVDTSEHREEQTRNAITASQRMVAEEVRKTSRVRFSFTRLIQTISGSSDDLKFSPDAMGNFIADELRELEVRVRGATAQSLNSLSIRSFAAFESESRGSHHAIPE